MIQALGMHGAVHERWQRLRHRALAAQISSSDRVSQFATAPRPSALPAVGDAGLGAYLAVQGEITPGAMIACSIMLGSRAWRRSSRRSATGPWCIARAAGLGTSRKLRGSARAAETPPCPGRARSLTVNKLTVVPPERRRRACTMFASGSAGPALGVIGPSARASRRWRGRWRRVAARRRRGAARRCRARPVGARTPRQLHRLPAAGRRAVRRHHRREHRPLPARRDRRRSSPPPRTPAPRDDPHLPDG